MCAPKKFYHIPVDLYNHPKIGPSTASVLLEKEVLGQVLRTLPPAPKLAESEPGQRQLLFPYRCLANSRLGRLRLGHLPDSSTGVWVWHQA